MWTGLFCNEEKPASTEATKTTTTSTEPVEPSLFILTDNATPNVVSIILPKIGSYKVSIKEMLDSEELLVKEYLQEIPARFHSIEDLEPGKTYSICITSTEYDDTLCGEVTTTPVKVATPTTKPPKTTSTVLSSTSSSTASTTVPTPHTDDVFIASVSEKGVDPSAIVEEDAGHDSQPFDLLYPIIGAGAVIFFVVVFMVLYCCHRRRAALKTRETDSDTSRYSANYSQGKTVVVSSFEPVHKLNSNNNRQDQISSPVGPQSSQSLLMQNNDMYHMQQHDGRPSNATTPPLLSASTRNSSLGRNSQSSCSTSGVSASHVLDPQRGYSPNHTVARSTCDQPCCAIPEEVCYVDSGRYPVTERVLYNIPNNDMNQNNRNSDMAEYRMRNGSASDNSSLTDKSYQHIMPIRSTTSVNQYHQGPIVTTTVNPGYLYPHQITGSYAPPGVDIYPLSRGNTPYIPVTSQYPGRYADTARHLRTDGYLPPVHTGHAYEAVVM